MVKLQAFRTPFTALFTMQCCLIARIPFQQCRTSLLCLLNAFSFVVRIPLMLMILSLVSLQIFFTAFPWLLKSPLRSCIIRFTAICFLLRLHYIPTIPYQSKHHSYYGTSKIILQFYLHVNDTIGIKVVRWYYYGSYQGSGICRSSQHQYV